MKKLLYFAHGLSANGIESFLVNVMKHIDKSKYAVTVIIAIDEGVECLHEKAVLDMGIRVIHAGDMDSLKKKLDYFKNILRMMKAEHYDIVHANMDLMNGIVLHFAKKCGIKKRICHAHNSKSQYNPVGRLAFVKRNVQKLYSFTMKRLMQNSSTDFLACSKEAGEYFYGSNPYKLIYNGIDIDRFNADVPDDYLRIKKPHVIVCVGRLTMQKNPIFAVEIANELKKIRNDFQIIWVGVGELENEVKSKIRELSVDDVFSLVGLRTDIPQILNSCDLFLMPSLFEGLPVSLVEAQASSLKCLVSDVVTKQADMGLCEYFSLEKCAGQWAKKISTMLDEPKEKANEEKLKLFDIKNTVSVLETIYR